MEANTMAKKSKVKSRYKEPKFKCPQCEKPYNYNTVCNVCKLKVIGADEEVPKQNYDVPLVSVVDDKGMPTLIKDMIVDPVIDLSNSFKAKVNKRTRFNDWMKSMYGMIDDVVDMAFSKKSDEELRDGLKFSVLEQEQVNQFVFLILKNYFPTALDSICATGGVGGDGGIVSIVISGVFVAMIILKKVRLVSAEMQRRDKNEKIPTTPVTDIPTRYRQEPITNQ